MTKKIFISYSHKDEEHFENFLEHLSALKRDGTVSEWHDRKIIAGDDWKDKIDENLESADIVILLISSSFLASDYCNDVEVEKALQRQKRGHAKIISVIVRNCDWKNCKFSKFQVVPKDGKAIIAWDNKDAAWDNVIQNIRKHIEEFTPRLEVTPLHQNRKYPISALISEWIEDTEITLTHRKVDRIRLSDVYVIPDVRRVENSNSKDTICIDSAIKIINTPGHYIVAGDEQQGKTSLLKFFLKRLSDVDTLILYIDATEINKSDADYIVNKMLSQQYDIKVRDEFDKASHKALLIDNIDRINLNQQYRNVFIENIGRIFDFVICSCDSSFFYVLGENPAFCNYNQYELLGFGNVNREELIKKWISLGVEENINDTELYSQCDEIKQRLDSLVKKNIVPRKPIYILMLLQIFEAHSKLDLDLTSYGHCYQQLIYQSFDKAEIHKSDFDKYLNVLTELAWRIFVTNNNLNDQQICSFFDDYCNTYLSVERETVINKLILYSILTKRSGGIGFKYQYIYYFFVGKRIAESYADSSEVIDAVSKMLSNLHREDFANILIFITHHTKDSWVLSKIQEVLDSLFNEEQLAPLSKSQLSFIGNFIKTIPELIIEQREIHKEREAHNKRLDDIERENEIVDKEDNASNADAGNDFFDNISKIFKGMEVAGQIIRNRHATLKREALYALALSGASSGLRFLEYFIKTSDDVSAAA